MQPHHCFHRHQAGSVGRAVPAIVLIAIGAIFLLNNLHVLYVRDISSYWPVLLIALGVFKMVVAAETRGRVAGGILFGTGVVFLADTLGFLDVPMRDLWWPVLLIALGLMMLLTRGSHWHHGFDMSKMTGRSGVPKEAGEAVVFSGGKRVIVDQNFQGGRYEAIFGGYELDFRRAEIQGDAAVLELNAIFGGIEARVPESWSVSLKGGGVFGGFVDNTTQPDPRLYPSPKRLIVNGDAVFGGVEVKN